jgi:mono/diheme cytochrome c family protein
MRVPILLAVLALLVAGGAGNRFPGLASRAPLPAPQAQAGDTAALYNQHCGACHGRDGTGNGLARVNLDPPPTDFTRGVFKLHTTAAGHLPTDEDLWHSIRSGVPGTAMPGFSDLLTQDQQLALVAYVKTFSARFANEEPGLPFTIPQKPASGPGGIANGKDRYATLGCAGCHGDDARGVTGKGTDLTASWSFKAGSDPEDIFRVLSVGVEGTTMPAYADKLTEGERWELVFFIKSIARVPAWRQTNVEFLAKTPTGGIADPLMRGAYLVRALGCGRCHTPVAPDGTYQAERALSGGVRVEAWPYGVFYGANLTSDPQTGLGNWSADEIVRALRTGQSKNSLLGLTRLNAQAMPWPYYAALSDDDAQAIAAYLKTVPPIYNAVPAYESYGFFGTLSGKVEMLFLGTPPTLEIAPGNFGNPVPGAAPASPALRHTLAPVWAVLTILLQALLFYVLVQYSARMRFNPAQRRVAGYAAWISFVIALVFGAWLYFSPPSTTVAQPALAPLDDPGKQALAARGQYLATIGACGSCHTAVPGSVFAKPGAPLAGGAQARGALFGAAYARNLTPDDTGLAGWNEVEIARALRAGRGLDGRGQHWEAMPWDFYSNWNEEDARTLALYLLALAPQRHEIPPIAPPAPDDPPAVRVTLIDFGR